ncbi:MAG: zinc-binding dehydrogenase [Verrucomicrobia bacterium]|nr:zinc-binding dehydrogenase [Verrucomicrobiota bacterium]
MKAKAAVFTEVGKPMEIREYPVPDPAPGDALIRITLSNICGSDLHFVHGLGPGVKSGPPRVMGHEMVGRIAKLGEGVTHDGCGQKLSEGDRVVYPYWVPCGACPACLRGDAACQQRYRHWLGTSCEEHPHFRGAYGEYYYLRRGQPMFKVPDDLPDAMVSPTNCILSEAYFGISTAQIELEDVVVIQGVGGLGLYATAMAREKGASKIIVIDRIAGRLELAKQFGADVTLDASSTTKEQRLQAIRELTHGDGADSCLEIAGTPAVVREGIESLRVGGRYVLVGNVNFGPVGEFEPGQVVRHHRSIHTVMVYPPWIMPKALAFLQRCRARYPFDRIISHTFPLEKINDAFEFAPKAIRVALQP